MKFNFKPMGVAALGATVLFSLPVKALAVPTPSCNVAFKKVVYQAVFHWNGKAKGTLMRLEIGANPANTPSTPWIAKIVETLPSGANICHATCEAKPFTDEGLQLSCQAEGFNALATPATLFFMESALNRYPSIRFGSWLNGYQHSPLKVEVDRLHS